MHRATFSILFVFALTPACFADVPPPPPTGAPFTLEVRSAPSAAVTLRVPADLLKGGRADMLYFNDSNDDGSRFRNAVAGVLLSLSVAMAAIVIANLASFGIGELARLTIG